MILTEDEIRECWKICHNDTDCETCKLWTTQLCTKVLTEETLKLVDHYKKEKENLEYTLMAVMHSVDKWLDGDELKQDEANRAATMREKTLQIIEKEQAENRRLKKVITEINANLSEQIIKNTRVKL